MLAATNRDEIAALPMLRSSLQHDRGFRFDRGPKVGKRCAVDQD
jgi:hypothetical protein